MQRRYDKFLCIILSILVFLSGICFARSEAVTPSLQNPQEKTNVSINSVHLKAADAQVCTPDMLRVQMCRKLQPASSRNPSFKKASRFFFAFLCLPCLSLLEGQFFFRSGITQLNSQCFNERITNYIHNSDGKKRIIDIPIQIL